jgi:hypothetical protein|tara:strand:- start:330 stop:548 length:219 start_codon:yes stop_codon:yes gene_type:complete
MIVSIYHHFIGFLQAINDWPRAGMVDSLDLKSSGIYPVPVRVRPRLPKVLIKKYFHQVGSNLIILLYENINS